MSQVINFPKLGRRKAVQRLTKNYAPMLVHVMQNSMLDDGEHFDENDLPMCRALDRTEMRHGAVLNAGFFLTAIMERRGKMEPGPARPGDLYGFALNAFRRVNKYRTERMGNSKIVVSGKYKRDLTQIELNYSAAIFAALKIEAVNDPEFNEPEFWADVFRGMADADPSGVVLRAAGLVLLDHMDTFRAAIREAAKETA